MGIKQLIKLLANNGVPSAGDSIVRHMSDEDAGFVYQELSGNDEKVQKKVNCIQDLMEREYTNGRKSLISFLAYGRAPYASGYIMQYSYMLGEEAGFIFHIVEIM